MMLYVQKNQLCKRSPVPVSSMRPWSSMLMRWARRKGMLSSHMYLQVSHPRASISKCLGALDAAHASSCQVLASGPQYSLVQSFHWAFWCLCFGPSVWDSTGRVFRTGHCYLHRAILGMVLNCRPGWWTHLHHRRCASAKDSAGSGSTAWGACET